ncbi:MULTISPECIES: Eco57I restriction-modification methylase domain-containing protein [Luteibacter]|uniref:Eco57I restriction-modification methylase domain-containing protein n=1 Tax=Luteibacter TaxID=242605 RepID=UPI0009E077F3|nr:MULTISPECIES: type I restriction-modification system subunit M [unclassified Luteibacter]
MALSQKESGAYYTPPDVAEVLLKWAVRHEADRLLDPSCGDGRFISGHRNSVGIEQDALAAHIAIQAAPSALVHEGDFFAWATNTAERFECAAGNPPFIRYQTFKGDVREAALQMCRRVGAHFSGLASSWAPFLVATASLLKPTGRMAFVVPAEIGHAPYAVPLVEFLVNSFSVVQVIAVKKKLFPNISEDCWLLYADGYGGRTDEIRFSAIESLPRRAALPKQFTRIPVIDWKATWKGRLRPFLLANEARDLYSRIRADDASFRFGDVAQIGIGYVSGANDFFHLRPSQAKSLRIPSKFLHATVRNGRALPSQRLTPAVVKKWHDLDEQVLLLRLPRAGKVPASIERYLDSEAAHAAKEGYKCRTRDPWFSVPDVQIPDFFLSYMSGAEASLVRNEADCTCTNSVHSVRLRDGVSAELIRQTWENSLARLSCEIEGHPLGGGMLKLEPREASNVVLSQGRLGPRETAEVRNAISTMKSWRHYGPA